MEQQVQLHHQITRFLTNFRKVGRNNYTSALVRQRIRSLEGLWRRFNDDHATLKTSIPPPSRGSVSYFSENLYDEAEDAYNLALDHLAEVLEELEPPSRPKNPGEAFYTRPSAFSFTTSHLPVINISPFDGDETAWESFRDRFTAIVIENKELHDFARMHYLVSALRGRALDCLAGLAVKAENFEVGWRLLKDRFDNKRRLISVMLSTLLNAPRLTRESAADLQALSSKFKLTLLSLANLQRSPADLWDDFLVHILVQRLDPATRRAWTLRSRDTDEPPAYADLDRFVSDRVRSLEDFARDVPRATSARSCEAPRVHNAGVVASSQHACPLCHASHYFTACPRFLGVSVARRRDLALKHRRCFNCLSPKHPVGECQSKHSCRRCRQRHHSLLHNDHNPENSLVTGPPRVDAVQADGPSAELHALAAADCAPRRVPVILATARVCVRSAKDRPAVVRALLDQGSEVTLISERLSQQLRAKRLRLSASIRGVGGVSAGPVRYAVRLSISPPRSPSPSFDTTAVVLKSLTSYAPRQSIDISRYAYLNDLDLADPDPFSPEPIDLIIGSDLYSELLCEGVRKGDAGMPIAQRTVLGWIISGPIRAAGAECVSAIAAREASQVAILSSLHCLETLHEDLTRFWELETVPSLSPRSPDDERCEAHFSATHSRTSEGRYRVRLPFRSDRPISVGSSRVRAARSLQTLHRRLNLNPPHREAYIRFLREYESMGHMRRVTSSADRRAPAVYLPHHPVFRGPSSAAGMRVVFNASSVTSNGTSLNEHVLTGPRLQADLTAVILRWRTFRYVYCADIAKMYRQILVDSRDLDHQRILWSENLAEAPGEYQLLTVTYGMACAPFLALRVLRQLCLDEGHNFPLASGILQRNIYVDDVLFGGDTRAEVVRARDQLVSLLQKGCFPLRKWSSNADTLLSDIPVEHRGSAAACDLSGRDTISVLGLSWVPSEDVFKFSVALPARVPDSKRSILSFISKLFDPLGWIAPVIVTAKQFIQSLWRHNLKWDDVLPAPLLHQWSCIFRGLSHVAFVRVPRWTGALESGTQLELHGFADASNAAYAAVVYCRTRSSCDDVTMSLLTSKTKVAPIKPVSVPRLELCAALTLARLLAFVRESLSLAEVACYCWSDSRVVLTWLSKHPSEWKVFVSHRVHEIQSRLPNAQWRHVPSSDNPADCASRGLFGGDLPSHPLWWHGPPWLAKSQAFWPESSSAPSDDSELERQLVSLHVDQSPSPLELLTRFSSWPRMIRVVAYVRRFVSACRRVSLPRPDPCVDNRSLSFAECNAARLFVIRALQIALFPSEVQALRRQRPLPSKNSLLSLAPFLDQDGVLRVGGRLSKAPFPFGRRHPILLSQHRLTDLLIDHAHLRALHSGVQLTLNVVRRDFWILRVRGMVRRRVHNCVTCTRERASTSTQLMGDLPSPRVSAPSRAFSHVGVDYAGPVTIRSSSGRGARSRKAYVSLFVCLATRAIHLELVSDYTSVAFVNAFSRFAARRGLPTAVYSDNGTTFTGAERELAVAYRTASRDPNVLNKLASDGIRWEFIPPAAPHFGGLWEAGVKSVKHHLRRVTKGHILTAEELSTLLCRVEACVNSRPIAPLSDNLDEYEPLTPGHFLIGSAITTHPEPSVLDVNENRLSRWQLVRHMTERFWHHWYTDYVNLLQQRSKWRSTRPPVETGRLVLIRNSTLPPCKWELGRVTRCHPGSDGLIRVVTVKTATSEIKRPVVQVCVLPIDCVQPEPIVKHATSL